MDDIYENIDEYNPNNKRKILIIFDNMIADKHSNKKLYSIVKELFIRSRKLSISIVFTILRNVRLNSVHYFIMKVLNKEELQ